MKDKQLIINRIRPDMVKRHDMMSASDVVDVLGLSLLGIVPDDENIVIATNKGEPLVDTDTAAGEAYMNICRRICGKDVPIPDFSHKENKVIRFMSKLWKKEKTCV